MSRYTLTLAIAVVMLIHENTAMALEEPDYEVIRQTGTYEIRRYSPYIVAEVDVEGNGRSASNSAFRILAGYIFGNNQGERKMKMTAPVESRERNDGTRMAMTALR